MQRDELYLADIIAAAASVEKYLSGCSPSEFERNELLQSAVLHKLMIVGEATAQLSEALKSQNMDVRWREIVAFRNLVVHRYFRVDLVIVWNTATKDLPTYAARIRPLLSRLGDANSPAGNG